MFDLKDNKNRILLGSVGGGLLLLGLDIAFGDAKKFVIGQLGKSHMPAHGQVGTIDLQQEACRDNGLVFLPHRQSNCLDVLILTGVVLVLLKYRNDAR